MNTAEKINQTKNEIKLLLNFYISTSCSRSGMKWTEEHTDEIGEMVDQIDKLISMRVRETIRCNKGLQKYIKAQLEKAEHKSC